MVRQPAIGFVGIWFFLILAPSSSVVPVVGQPMAEHRMYLPLAAVVTLSVMVIEHLAGTTQRRGVPGAGCGAWISDDTAQSGLPH